MESRCLALIVDFLEWRVASIGFQRFGRRRVHTSCLCPELARSGRCLRICEFGECMSREGERRNLRPFGSLWSSICGGVWIAVKFGLLEFLW